MIGIYTPPPEDRALDLPYMRAFLQGIHLLCKERLHRKVDAAKVWRKYCTPHDSNELTEHLQIAVNMGFIVRHNEYKRQRRIVEITEKGRKAIGVKAPFWMEEYK